MQIPQVHKNLLQQNMIFLYLWSFCYLPTLYSEHKIFRNMFAISIDFSGKKLKSKINDHSGLISMEFIENKTARGVSFSKISKALLKHICKWSRIVTGLVGSDHPVVLFKNNILKMLQNSLKNSCKGVYSKVSGCVSLEPYQKMNTIIKCVSKILSFNSRKSEWLFI